MFFPPELITPNSKLVTAFPHTYDSRNQQQGDFGIGWTLDIHNIQVEESGVQGQGWETYLQAGGLLEGNYNKTYISPTGSHFVDIVLGNGKVYSFEPHFLDKDSHDVAPGGHGEDSISVGTFGVTFESLFGTAPNCTLVPVDGSGDPMTVVWANGSPDVKPDVYFTWTDENHNDYNPLRFILTDENGNQYIVNTSTGLEQMTDLNGNTLKVDNAGIHWVGAANGRKDISFSRDKYGRIAQIQDPKGYLYM